MFIKAIKSLIQVTAAAVPAQERQLAAAGTTFTAAVLREVAAQREAEKKSPHFKSVTEQKGFIKDTNVLTRLVEEKNQQLLEFYPAKNTTFSKLTAIHQIRLIVKKDGQTNYIGDNGEVLNSLVLTKKGQVYQQSVLEELGLPDYSHNYEEVISLAHRISMENGNLSIKKKTLLLNSLKDAAIAKEIKFEDVELLFKEIDKTKTQFLPKGYANLTKSAVYKNYFLLLTLDLVSFNSIKIDVGKLMKELIGKEKDLSLTPKTEFFIEFVYSSSPIHFDGFLTAQSSSEFRYDSKSNTLSEISRVDFWSTYLGMACIFFILVASLGFFIFISSYGSGSKITPPKSKVKSS